jgi:hypothetical protein
MIVPNHKLKNILPVKIKPNTKRFEINKILGENERKNKLIRSKLEENLYINGV